MEPLAAVAAVAAAAAPAGPRKIADGVFVVGGGYQVMAVDFKDHIVLIEAPQNGIADMVAQAKQAIPNKPITHVVLTHNHWDHAGGLRTVLAEGPNPVTLVTNEMNKAVFEKWFSNPRTLQATTPAAGAAAPAPAPAAGGRGGGAAPAPWPDALQAVWKEGQVPVCEGQVGAEGRHTNDRNLSDQGRPARRGHGRRLFSEGKSDLRVGCL